MTYLFTIGDLPSIHQRIRFVELSTAGNNKGCNIHHYQLSHYSEPPRRGQFGSNQAILCSVFGGHKSIVNFGVYLDFGIITLSPPQGVLEKFH